MVVVVVAVVAVVAVVVTMPGVSPSSVPTSGPSDFASRRDEFHGAENLFGVGRVFLKEPRRVSDFDAMSAMKNV